MLLPLFVVLAGTPPLGGCGDVHRRDHARAARGDGRAYGLTATAYDVRASGAGRAAAQGQHAAELAVVMTCARC